MSGAQHLAPRTSPGGLVEDPLLADATSTDDERNQARLTVASVATDAADLRLLLDHLGLNEPTEIRTQLTARRQARFEEEYRVNTKQGQCAKCQQTRPLFEFSFMPDGWAEFITRQLCARCWSECTLADENNEYTSLDDLIRYGTDEQILATLRGAS